MRLERHVESKGEKKLTQDLGGEHQRREIIWKTCEKTRGL